MIVAAKLDGTKAKQLVTNQVWCPTNLRLDLPLQTLYWVEPEMHVIESIKTDGTNRRVSCDSCIVSRWPSLAN